MTKGVEVHFDVFLSHASEDKDEVRILARGLKASGLRVWLDEEQLPPGVDPQDAIKQGLEQSQHVLIWITQAWLDKSWTRWELGLFAEALKNRQRRVVPVLRVPWDDGVLGPYLTQQAAIAPECGDDARVWLVVCGVRGSPPGPRESWTARGRELVASKDHFANQEPPHREPIVDESGTARATINRHKWMVGTSIIGGVTASLWLLCKPGGETDPGGVVKTQEVAPVAVTGGSSTGSNFESANDGDVSGGRSFPPEFNAPEAGIQLVLIPRGTFTMGSPVRVGKNDERPQHEVTLEAFYLAKTPVTNAQYRRYMEANPSVAEPEYWGDPKVNQPDQPVVGVSWDEARAYCKWAGLTLPTEAQWEYACRAGTTTAYYSGDTEEDLAKVGWYGGNSDRRLNTVGKLKPNAFGLFDMHGNVWEWCMDSYGSYETRPRPGGGLRHAPVGDADRVVRGGSWGPGAEYARSAFRHKFGRNVRILDIGFRPAKIISERSKYEVEWPRP